MMNDATVNWIRRLVVGTMQAEGLDRYKKDYVRLRWQVPAMSEKRKVRSNKTNYVSRSMSALF